MDKKVLISEALKLENPFQKHMKIAGAISSAFAERNSEVTVVGGLAVEFYTNAGYMTQDIDLLTSKPEHIKGVMMELGFENRGGIWCHKEDPTVTVEFPPAPFAGDYDKVFPVRFDQHTVGIIGIEDIIVSRANEAKYWGRGDSAEEWARYMMAAHFRDIDWKYLRDEAQKERCFDVVERCYKWAKFHVKQIENERNLRDVPVREIKEQLVQRLKVLDERLVIEQDPDKQGQLMRSKVKTKDFYDSLSKVDKKAVFTVGGELSGQNLLRQRDSIQQQVTKLLKRTREHGFER